MAHSCAIRRIHLSDFMLMLGVLDSIALKRFGCERVRISNLECGGKRKGNI